MKNKSEAGVVVVEATVIVTLVILVFMVMAYLGLILYQQTMLSVVANQTAESIAQLYGNNIKDPFTGYIEETALYQNISYTGGKDDDYIKVLEEKAEALAKYRLEAYRLLGSEEEPEIKVQVVKKSNEVLKSQIVVTIEDAYNLPLAGLFEAVGLFDLSVSGRADCVDLIEYLNGVEAVGDPENTNVSVLPDMDPKTVTFIVGRGQPQVVATVKVLTGNSIAGSSRYTRSAMPDDPVWGDRKFAGWETSDGERFSSATAVSSNLTVYGTWQYQVTFCGEGGTVNGAEQAQIYITAGGRGAFPTPVRAGYAFAGWYTQANGGGSQYLSNDTVINSNISLYAAWECTHDYEAAQISAGNCRTRSVWRYSCIRCPHSYEQSGDYGTCQQGSITVIQPSCTGNGSKVAHCTVCSRTMVNETIPALGHAYEAYTKAATCTEEGFDGQKCSRCQHLNGTSISRLGHSYTAEMIDAGNCRTKSKWKYTCTRCGYSYEAEGNYGTCQQGSTTVIAATCTAKGSEVARCTGCNRIMVNKTIPALGHNYQTYSRASTCTQTGISGKKCSRCGHETGTVLAMKEHDWSARCGETHYLVGKRTIGTHNKSAGYQYSTALECLLCINCGQPHGGWVTRSVIENGRTKNQTMSQGTICRQHVELKDDGTWRYQVSDNAYDYLKEIDIHG